jgi:hypothetical protein
LMASSLARLYLFVLPAVSWSSGLPIVTVFQANSLETPVTTAIDQAKFVLARGLAIPMWMNSNATGDSEGAARYVEYEGSYFAVPKRESIVLFLLGFVAITLSMLGRRGGLRRKAYRGPPDIAARDAITLRFQQPCCSQWVRISARKWRQ